MSLDLLTVLVEVFFFLDSPFHKYGGEHKKTQSIYDETNTKFSLLADQPCLGLWKHILTESNVLKTL